MKGMLVRDRNLAPADGSVFKQCHRPDAVVAAAQTNSAGGIHV